MNVWKKVLVPGCFPVLAGYRIQCGIAIAEYSEITEHEENKILLEGIDNLELKKIKEVAGERGFKICVRGFATPETILTGITYLIMKHPKIDTAEVRKIVGEYSIECASALYGGIVFMLDNEILSTFVEIPENYVLAIFETAYSPSLKNCHPNIESYLDFVSGALSMDLEKCSEALAEIQGSREFWDKHRELRETSIFWGLGANNMVFSVMKGDNVRGHEINRTGLLLEEIDD
ncbi:MAG: hypothetical protein ACPL1Y_01070 [Thermoplasmata archaeon]